MKFWKRLRWLATVLFLCVVLGIWWFADPPVAPGGSAEPSLRPPPAF